MSLTELFLAIYPYLCFFMVNGAILAILLPNRIIDTSSTNKHWIAVCLIGSGLFGIRSDFSISFTILLLMTAGVMVHYLRNRKPVTSAVSDVLPTNTADFLKRVK